MFSKERTALDLAIKAQSAVIDAHIAMRDSGLVGMNDAILTTQKAVRECNAALLAAYNRAAEGKGEEAQDHLWSLAFGELA